MFVDRVKVSVKAGRGGNGCLSFRREYRVPKGGPDGGHGGNGGNVFFVSEAGLNTLAYFRFHPLNRARDGAPGEGNDRSGKKGADLVLRVPVGTIVKDAGSGEVLFDFVSPGQKFLAAKAGRGGRGNASFATSTHQTPREHEPGKPGEEKELTLELKLIADVGLIGFPNVGKSTLISRISAARPVIADYPFTTLVPHLGVVDIGEKKSFVVADIPGLIEGAHHGHGLGVDFLRHIERTRTLVHILDVSPHSGRDPVHDYDVVNREIRAFNPKLAERPQIVVANKIDLLGSDKSRLASVEKLAAERGLLFFAVSAVKREGLKDLIRAIAGLLGRMTDETAEAPPA